MTLRISVSTVSEQDIRLLIVDADPEPALPNTVLTNRVGKVNGNFDFMIGLPLVRKYVDVIVVNDRDNSDSSFTYNGYEKQPLIKRMDSIDMNKNHLRSFVTFMNKFCYNASVLPTNNPNNPRDMYRSDDWRFFIKYLDVIRDYKTGVESSTPARISCDTGLIEVSQKYFVPYTVPMRVATITHEYSHPWLNADPDDESEADINGLLIFRGQGFPKYEAAEAWCQILGDNDTPENIERLAIIMTMLDDYDSGKILFN